MLTLSPSRTVEVVVEETPTRAVELGVAFLDEHEPGWASKVDADSLDLWSPTYCVLGQIYGTYEKGLAVHSLREQDGIRYGFNIPLVSACQRMADLQAEWVRIIEERR